MSSDTIWELLNQPIFYQYAMETKVLINVVPKQRSHRWHDIKNNAWVTVNNDFWVTSEAICQ